MEQVLKLCDAINGVASYVTVEHLKINTDNEVIKDLFKDEIDKYKRTSIMRNLELPSDVKKKNIEEIKKHLPHTLIGVGDNDLHYLSESRCCCGIDTINKNFDNYLKYNLTYFTTEHLGKKISEDESIWIPKCNCANSVNVDVRIKNISGYKDYVDSYCSKYNDFMCDGCSMKNKLQGISYAKSTGKRQQQITIFNIDEINEVE